MALTEEVNRLVSECGSLNKRLADRLKGTGLDFLIWESPTSVRDPEATRLFHPLYLKKGAIFRFCTYLYSLCYYFYLGIKQFFVYHGFYYLYLKDNAPMLLIMPDEITDHAPNYKTNYLIEGDNFPIDRLIFSKDKAIGPVFSTLNFRNKIGISFKLFSSVVADIFSSFCQKKITREYCDTLLIFIRWLISQSWYFHWDFYYLVNNILSTNRNSYKVLFSMHEMHFYSRIIWRIADEKRIMAITAQHAMIVPEKLWYFSNAAERQAGLALPSIFFVYSDRIKKMLQPYYPDTKFMLCCSPRFNKWRSFSLDNRRYNHLENKKLCILFVAGIMFYDVKILIRAIKNLLNKKETGQMKIRFRLHPHGNISKMDRLWLREASRFGKIEISSNTLEKDLSEAAIMLGSNSMVIQEAYLLGVPVLSVFSSDYMSSTIMFLNADSIVPAEDISWERIKEHMNGRPDESLADRFKTDMGIYNPDLSTELIYEACKYDL